MYKIDTGASLSFLERLGTDDSVSRIDLSLELICPITYYIICILLHKSECI